MLRGWILNDSAVRGAAGSGSLFPWPMRHIVLWNEVCYRDMVVLMLLVLVVQGCRREVDILETLECRLIEYG